mgnify:CR=1 FL=1
MIFQEGNPITFTQATVYAPLILILILYLPTIIYIVFVSIRFYGLQRWINEIMSHPVYFIFPILTSLSFYEKAQIDEIETHDAQIAESSNYKITDVDGTETVETTTEKTDEITVAAVNISNDVLPVVETEKTFSVRQSNILYLLFCLSSSLCIFGDLWHQWIRGKNSHNLKWLRISSGSSLSPYTSAASLTFGANLILWVDFIMSKRDSDSASSNGNSFFQDLLGYTTHAAFCILFLPFLGVYKLFSR